MNIPPDKRGLIHENDVEILRKWRKVLDETFKDNLAANALIVNEKSLSKQEAKSMTDNDYDTYWMAEEETPTLEFSLAAAKTFDRLLLQEKITVGQRVEKFKLEAKINGKWGLITEGTTIGYKRLLRFPEVTTEKLRLTIIKSRANPALAEFGIYKSAAKDNN